MKTQPNFKVFVREYCTQNNILLSKVILDRTLATTIRKTYNIKYGIKSKETA